MFIIILHKIVEKNIYILLHKSFIIYQMELFT